MGGVDSPLDFVVAGCVDDSNGDVSSIVEDSEVCADVFGFSHFGEDGDGFFGVAGGFSGLWG